MGVKRVVAVLIAVLAALVFWRLCWRTSAWHHVPGGAQQMPVAVFVVVALIQGMVLGRCWWYVRRRRGKGLLSIALGGL